MDARRCLGGGSAPAPASARHLFVDGAPAAPLPRGPCYAILAFTSKDGYNYEHVSNVSTCIENRLQKAVQMSTIAHCCPVEM